MISIAGAASVVPVFIQGNYQKARVWNVGNSGKAAIRLKSAKAAKADICPMTIFGPIA